MKKFLLVFYTYNKSKDYCIYQLDSTFKDEYSFIRVKYEGFCYTWTVSKKWVHEDYLNENGMDLVWGKTIEELDEQLMLRIL